MITIDGIYLDDRYSWIESGSRLGAVSPSKKGVIFLVSINNAQPRFGAWQKMIKALNPGPEKVIFCENDSTDRTVDIINNWDFPHELISFKSKKADTQKDIYAVIARNRQYLLERARKLNPEFAIFLDDDVFPDDENIIEKLTYHKLPIVGGAYLRPFADKGVFVSSYWDINAPLKDLPPAIDLEDLVRNGKREGSPFLMFSACENCVYKVAATSAGCLCLSRKVIQDSRLKFSPRKRKDAAEGTSEDFGFCLLAKNYGYAVCLDGDTRLSHLVATPEKLRPWIKR